MLVVEELIALFVNCKFQDNTAGHFNDANQLLAIGQMVTGVNDAAMGQAQTGCRSASENARSHSRCSFSSSNASETTSGINSTLDLEQNFF